MWGLWWIRHIAVLFLKLHKQCINEIGMRKKCIPLPKSVPNYVTSVIITIVRVSTRGLIISYKRDQFGKNPLASRYSTLQFTRARSYCETIQATNADAVVVNGKRRRDCRNLTNGDHVIFVYQRYNRHVVQSMATAFMGTIISIFSISNIFYKT